MSVLFFRGAGDLTPCAPPFPPAARATVLAPHPDDFDAIGVTLRWCRDAGMTLHLAVLTGGASGVQDGYRGARTDREKRAIREEEQRASAGFFGLPAEAVTFLRLAEGADGHLVSDTASHECVRGLLLRTRPDVVFMPHGNDSNPDHQRGHAMFTDIAASERLNVLVCLNRDPKTVAMRPDFYVGFGEPEAWWKGELLRFHQSQHQRNLDTRGYGFDERVLRVNRQIAAERGLTCSHAECFECRHTAA